jgi:hypothetical protein
MADAAQFPFRIEGSSMSDTFRTVTSTSWFGRIQRSFGGVIFGLVLIVAMVALLFWNEGRAVQTEKALAEGAGIVVNVEGAPIDPANEGKLVHVSGPIVTQQTLSDPTFAISAEGVRLVRKVEMFQWTEEKSSKTETKLGGGEETVTTYTYSKEWHEGPVDSSDFAQPDGHQNPQPVLESQSFQIDDAGLGDYALTQSILSDVGGGKAYPIPNTQRDAIVAASPLEQDIKLIDGVITASANPSAPAVGDLKIAYELVPLHEVSIIAQQSGKSLSPYQTEAGDQLQLVDDGIVAAPAMFKAAADENSLITWIIRAVGLVLLVVGFSLVVGPLGVIADFVPFIGSIVRFGTGIIASSLGLGIGTLTIALAWLFYRPLLSIIILVIGAAAVAGIVYIGKARAKPAAAKPA